MSLRLFVDSPLDAGLEFALPDDAARHVQVRRLQPDDALRLFDGTGGEWTARVLRMGKRDVEVRVDAHAAIDRELPFDLHIALGMPANERMDALIEKATELGVASVQPLQTERSVLRLDADRAAKRVAHWRAVAVGASEQSGRTRVPDIRPVCTLAAWLAARSAADGGEGEGVGTCFVMSTSSAPGLPTLLRDGARRSAMPIHPDAAVVRAASDAQGPPGASGLGRRRWLALSGPEGGLSPEEEAAATARGFMRLSLGGRILRADTAPLAWLAQMAALLAG